MNITNALDCAFRLNELATKLRGRRCIITVKNNGRRGPQTKKPRRIQWPLPRTTPPHNQQRHPFPRRTSAFHNVGCRDLVVANVSNASPSPPFSFLSSPLSPCSSPCVFFSSHDALFEVAQGLASMHCCSGLANLHTGQTNGSEYKENKTKPAAEKCRI